MTAAKDHLQVSVFIQAKREKVFEAWIRPELMKKWFCPENLTPGVVEADVRVGGTYRGSMIDGSNVYTASGTYQEIAPNEKLVFTHGWEGPDRMETLVTVAFKDKDGGTEVTLTHERFASIEQAKGHEKGWVSALENLAKQFAQVG